MEASKTISKEDLARAQKRVNRRLSVLKRIAKRQHRSQLRHKITIYEVARKLYPITHLKRNGIKKANRYVIPRVFSLFDDPETVLRSVGQIAYRLSSSKCSHLTLDYSRCREYSLGSECLLGVIAKTIKFQREQHRKQVQLPGVYPEDQAHLEIIRDIGIVKEIDADASHRNRADRSRQLIFSRDRNNVAADSAHAMDDKNEAPPNFVKYLNNILSKGGFLGLDDKTTRKLQGCLGELLDNAERHALPRGIGKWYLRAHVNYAHSTPSCEISIFNFGKTIYETFQVLDSEHYCKKTVVTPYINLHAKKGGLTEESLTNVIALQPNVSCRNITSDDTGGTGTLELLEVFNELSHRVCAVTNRTDSAKMILLSGHTWMKFDGKHKFNLNSNQVYPFNNSSLGLKAPPDETHVHTLEHGFFPGVMINIRFALPPRYSKETVS